MPLGNPHDRNRFVAAFASMLWAQGGDLYDLTARKPVFQEDAGVYALQWLQDMALSSKAMPGGITTSTAETVDQQFTAGSIASTVANTGNLGDYKSRKSGDWVASAPFWASSS